MENTPPKPPITHTFTTAAGKWTVKITDKPDCFDVFVASDPPGLRLTEDPEALELITPVVSQCDGWGKAVIVAHASLGWGAIIPSAGTIMKLKEPDPAAN